MEEKELKQACLKLMETADVVYLSTIGNDGFPHTRIMSNLRNKKANPGLVKMFEQHKEDFLMYMVTSNSSAKMQQIQANPKVSLLAYRLEDPLRNIEVRGRVVEMTEDGALEHLNELNLLYTGLPNFFGDSVGPEMQHKLTPVKVRIEPVRVRVEG